FPALRLQSELQRLGGQGAMEDVDQLGDDERGRGLLEATAKLDVFQMRQRDVRDPVLVGAEVELLIEAAAGEMESDVAEAELAAGGADSAPALLGTVSRADRFLVAGKRELAAHHRAEIAF